MGASAKIRFSATVRKKDGRVLHYPKEGGVKIIRNADGSKPASKR